MQAHITRTPPPPKAFIPVTLTLTFETPEEIRGYLALFNNSIAVRDLIQKQKDRHAAHDLFGTADVGIVDKIGGGFTWTHLKNTLEES